MRNADYRWAQFDSEAYFQHYYGEPHGDDDLVIRYAVEAMKRAQPINAELDVVDVGTGPNLIPFFCALPRARRLTAWEYAESNVAWLEAELRRDDMRPQWRHFWDVTRDAYGPEWRLPENPISLLRRRGSQTGIDLRPSRAHMGRRDHVLLRRVHYRTARRVRGGLRELRTVREAGGALIAAFLVRSAGYVVCRPPVSRPSTFRRID